jgi:archaellum component FlaC
MGHVVSFEQFIIAMVLVVVSNIAVQVFLRGLFQGNRQENGTKERLSALSNEVDSLREEIDDVVTEDDLCELKQLLDEKVSTAVCEAKMSRIEVMVTKIEKDIAEIKERLNSLEAKIDMLMMRR